jgi:uncharacterized membrane protein YcjF (UPF0283 family)
MVFRSTLLPKAGVLLVSVILSGILINAAFKTPNVVGGGEAKLVAILILAVLLKVAIEFFLTKWQKRRDSRRGNKT